MLTNRSVEATIPYRLNITLYKIFDDKAFKISRNRQATIHKFDDLIASQPRNEHHLKKCKAKLEAFYEAITHCDFDTFSALDNLKKDVYNDNKRE